MSEIGRVLQTRYKVIYALGVGGFGETYLANDLALPGSRLCVVKKIKALQLENSDPKHLKIVRRLFKTEAEILYKLGNEYNQIPSLYAYFEENGIFYLVQEFIDGAGLNSELNSKQNYHERQVLILLKEILEILVFVHSKGIIHRDVKPSNLIRRKTDKKLVLIDFGAVKEIGTLNSNYYGQSGLTVAIGTNGYMPSEQAQGRPRFNSDIYAVGMIGIQALTRSNPYRLSFNSEREYNFNAENNHIHLSEREGEFSIDYSNNSRKVELGGQETILQNNSTINQGDIDVTEIRDIDMNNGNYNEQKGNNNTMTNITQSHSGSGDNVGGDKNTTNNYNSQDLPQAAAEIQALLEQLEKTYPTNTTTGKMAIATEAIQQIDNDPKLAPRILSALQAGGISAFDSFLDHPAASFVIAALEDWQETKK